MKVILLRKISVYLKNHLTKHRLVCIHFEALCILVLICVQYLEILKFLTNYLTKIGVVCTDIQKVLKTKHLWSDTVRYKKRYCIVDRKNLAVFMWVKALMSLMTKHSIQRGKYTIHYYDYDPTYSVILNQNIPFPRGRSSLTLIYYIRSYRMTFGVQGTQTHTHNSMLTTMVSGYFRTMHLRMMLL